MGLITRTWLAALVGLILAGCGSEEKGERAGDEAADSGNKVGVSFNAKSGLFVPPDTAKLIGLEIVDVTEQKITSTVRFTAQVYRTNLSRTNSNAMASGFVDRTKVEELRNGQPLTIMPAGGEWLRGTMTKATGGTDQQGDVIEFIIEIDSAPQLRVGDYVEVVAPIGKDKVTIAVPRMALLQTLEGNFVYTVSGERLVRTAVKVGAITDEFAEIEDGLYEGDKIAVKPAMMLWLAELQSLRGGKACADGH